jgi:hypothetical protein
MDRPSALCELCPRVQIWFYEYFRESRNQFARRMQRATCALEWHYAMEKPTFIEWRRVQIVFLW